MRPNCGSRLALALLVGIQVRITFTIAAQNPRSAGDGRGAFQPGVDVIASQSENAFVALVPVLFAERSSSVFDTIDHLARMVIRANTHRFLLLAAR